MLKLTSKDLKDSDAISAGLVDRIQSTCDQWDAIKSTVKQRIHVGNDFIAVHQSADKVLSTFASVFCTGLNFIGSFHQDCFIVLCHALSCPVRAPGP